MSVNARLKKFFRTTSFNRLRQWLLGDQRIPIQSEESMHRESISVQNIDSPDVPAAAMDGSRPIQLAKEGSGSLYHRNYTIVIRDAKQPGAQIMTAVQADIDRFAPGEMVTFTKTIGSPGMLSIGDEFFIKVTGPWNAPVRVIALTPTSFTLITLRDHLEAGTITFQVETLSSDTFRFEIISEARSGNGIVELGYEHLGVLKAAQTSMWVVFLENVARESGGERVGDILVKTEQVKIEDE